MPEFDDMLPQNLCLEGGEIFFRGADVTRFDRVFQAVVNDAQHLLITSQYDGVIDHYGKMMLNRLKMRSGMAVETYMPASTEALVERFNQLVNSMTVEQARGDEPSQTPGRIIVVNDPRAIDSDGWALLSRMITDFPGLNMRLVFLLDRIPESVEKALDRFGSRLLRWEIEPPNANEQLALRKEGMATGVEFQVERVLSRINQTVSQQLEPNLDNTADAGLQIDVADALGETTAAGEREAEDMRALFEDEPSKKKRGGLGLILAALVLLVMATVVAAMVSPEVGRQVDRVLALVGVEDTLFQRDAAGGQSVVDAAYDAEQTETPQTPSGLTLPQLSPSEDDEPIVEIPETPRSQVTEEIAALDSNAQAIEGVAEDPIETSEGIASAPDALDTTEIEATPNVVTEPSVPSSQVSEQVESEAVEPETPNQNPAVRQVQSAPADAQFVQHIVLATEARAREWQGTQSGLADALVVPIQINATTRYAVVSGPFTERAATRTFIQGLGSDADYWIRSAGSLQGILQTEE